MPRPSRAQERRAELLPKVAHTFAELGFRRTTTKELAARLGVQEVVLYRLWPDKRAMFIAAIEHVYDLAEGIWDRLLGADDERSTAERLLDYEATHHGEFGLYRIVFAGLSESDDPEIRAALGAMYRRFHAFIVRRLVEHRGSDGDGDLAAAAWALIGMGTVTSIGRELALLTRAQRRALWQRAGPLLLGPRGS